MKKLIFLSFTILFAKSSDAFADNDDYLCGRACPQNYECRAGWGTDGPTYQCFPVRKNSQFDFQCDWNDLNCPDGYHCRIYWGEGPFQCLQKENFH